jgi:hypothetical protein
LELDQYSTVEARFRFPPDDSMALLGSPSRRKIFLSSLKNVLSQIQITLIIAIETLDDTFRHFREVSTYCECASDLKC